MPSPSLPKPLTQVVDLVKRLSTVKASEVKATIGVDIGSSSVKLLVLGPRKGSGPRPILAQEIVPLHNEEADSAEAIKSALAALKLNVKQVNVGVSGQWVIMRVVEMPALKPSEMKAALSFEAQRYLPFNIQDVEIDGEMLGPAEANKMWVLIVACKKDLIERRRDWAKRAGAELAIVDVDALALANAFLATANGQEAAGARALVNIGAQLTNVVIFQGRSPYLVRDIPWGAEKLVRSLANQTRLEEAAIKEQLTKNQVTPDVQGAMKQAVEALATELQLSFDYFENRFGQPPSEILTSGGLSQSSAFLEGLKSLLTQPVTLWSPVGGLSGQFAVAYGLALRTE